LKNVGEFHRSAANRLHCAHRGGRRRPGRAVTARPSEGWQDHHRRGFALEPGARSGLCLEAFAQANQVPALAVYVGFRRLTVKLIRRLQDAPECYERNLCSPGRRAIRLSTSTAFTTSPTREESKALAASGREPTSSFSASGMCEAGRILHHLREGHRRIREPILIVAIRRKHAWPPHRWSASARFKVFGVMRRLAAGGGGAQRLFRGTPTRRTHRVRRGRAQPGQLPSGAAGPRRSPPAQAAVDGQLAEPRIRRVHAPGPGREDSRVVPNL